MIAIVQIELKIKVFSCVLNISSAKIIYRIDSSIIYRRWRQRKMIIHNPINLIEWKIMWNGHSNSKKGARAIIIWALQKNQTRVMLLKGSPKSGKNSQAKYHSTVFKHSYLGPFQHLKPFLINRAPDKSNIFQKLYFIFVQVRKAWRTLLFSPLRCQFLK